MRSRSSAYTASFCPSSAFANITMFSGIWSAGRCALAVSVDMYITPESISVWSEVIAPSVSRTPSSPPTNRTTSSSPTERPCSSANASPTDMWSGS